MYLFIDINKMVVAQYIRKRFPISQRETSQYKNKINRIKINQLKTNSTTYEKIYGL